MNKGLSIVTDDFGLDTSVNNGIVFALKNNIVNGASIMANGEFFDDAIEKLKDLIDPNVGIHFVLVEEKPIAIKKLEKNHKTFFIKYLLGLINLGDIEKELRAQLGKCIKAGLNPSFINSHQHLHLLPRITDIVIRLAKENNIEYIRTVMEPFSTRAGLFRGLESVFLSLLSKKAKNKIEKEGIRTNDYFIGFLSAGSLKKEDTDLVMEISKKNQNKIVELGCHIGYENFGLREKYRHWGNYNWERELELVKTLQNYARL